MIRTEERRELLDEWSMGIGGHRTDQGIRPSQGFGRVGRDTGNTGSAGNGRSFEIDG
jgi:hypothetical protein